MASWTWFVLIKPWGPTSHKQGTKNISIFKCFTDFLKSKPLCEEIDQNKAWKMIWKWFNIAAQLNYIVKYIIYLYYTVQCNLIYTNNVHMGMKISCWIWSVLFITVWVLDTLTWQNAPTCGLTVLSPSTMEPCLL